MKKKKEFNDYGLDAIILISAAIFVNSVIDIYKINRRVAKREKANT